MQKADVAILTFTEEEFPIILTHFPYRKTETGRREYHFGTVALNRDVVRFALTRSERGNAAAALAISETIEDLDPLWILVVGTAGGKPTKDYTLGDVIVSTYIYDLCQQKVRQGGKRQYDPEGGPLERSASNVVQNLDAKKSILGKWNLRKAIGSLRPGLDPEKAPTYGNPEWEAKVRESLNFHFGSDNSRRRPKYCCGKILSTDWMVQDTELMAIWLDNYQRVDAVETESAGAYKAVRKLKKTYPFLTIRGVSDIVGLGPERDRAWVDYACHTAASFARALIGVLPIRSQPVDLSPNVFTLRQWQQHLHWSQKGVDETGSNLVDTQLIRQITDDLVKNASTAPKHYLVSGRIASGKTSCAERIGELFLQHENHTVFVLPLSRRFPGEEGWTRADSCRSLNEHLKDSPSPRAPTLLLIDDAHEAENVGGPNWTWQLDEKPKSYSILVTTRPGVEEAVMLRLKHNWGITPIVVSTEPDETALQLIQARLANVVIPTGRTQEGCSEHFYEEFEAAGQDLFFLSNIINGWIKDTSRAVDSNLAYLKLRDALDSLCEEITGDDTKQSQYALLAIWLLGGVDISTPKTFVEADIGISPRTKTWERWFAAKEITSDPTSLNCYRSARHPAWGRLVGRALEESGDFRAIAQGLRKHLIEQFAMRDTRIKKVASERMPRALACLLIHVLLSKLVEIEKLAFYCGAIYGNVFFIEAASAYIEIIALDDLTKSEVYLSLATICRRYSNPEDVSGRGAMLNKGEQWLHETVKLREKTFGDTLDSDPKGGWIRYEQGYFAFLRSDFIEAKRLFGASKELEIQQSAKRLWYAAQSCNLEAECTAYAGSYEEALALLDKASDLLDLAAKHTAGQSTDVGTTQRFHGNLHACRCYVYLYGGETDRAEKEISKFVESYKAAGIEHRYAESMLRARIHLQRNEWGLAQMVILPVIKSRQAMQHAETAEMAYRIFGDALLGLDRIKEAKEAYERGMPDPRSGRAVLDFAQTLIKKRLDKLDLGLQGEIVLKGEIL
jgi:nucleoside phosphorylase/tetratricopeptide (TPR) repeat protein